LSVLSNARRPSPLSYSMLDTFVGSGIGPTWIDGPRAGASAATVGGIAARTDASGATATRPPAGVSRDVCGGAVGVVGNGAGVAIAAAPGATPPGARVAAAAACA